MASYRERYLAGEHEEVWREIVGLGDAVRDEPALSDATAVARAMMGRVRRNLQRLISRLRASGYVFEEQEPLRDPDANVEGYLATMEKWGPLPLALRVFWEVVGEVSLDGTFPEGHAGLEGVIREEMGYPDSPLHVAGPLASFDAWMEAYEEEEPAAYLAICYDPTHTLGAFTLRGPCWPADTPLLMEEQDPMPGPDGRGLLFADYLRLSLHWGGFPSLAYSGKNPDPDTYNLAALMARPNAVTIAHLVEGFERF